MKWHKLSDSGAGPNNASCLISCRKNELRRSELLVPKTHRFLINSKGIILVISEVWIRMCAVSRLNLYCAHLSKPWIQFLVNRSTGKSFWLQRSCQVFGMLARSYTEARVRLGHELLLGNVNIVFMWDYSQLRKVSHKYRKPEYQDVSDRSVGW